MTHLSSHLVRPPIWFSILIILASCQSIPDNPQDIERLQKTAEQGDAEAQFLLGQMYLSGLGVSEDRHEAEKWLRKAADQGYDAAQFSLGLMYAKERGVPKDDWAWEATMWQNRAAAEQGDADAQFFLGLMDKDGREAVKWYGAAAEQGDANAQFFLGQMYAEGQRVPEDYVKAYAWLNLAAAQGIEAAEKTRTQIREKMTRAQVSEAQKLASDLFRRIESARSE